MLRLTRKTGYGLMALIYLAEHSNDTSLRARDIAEAYHIPLQLLAKSLQRLAKVGILRSHAGMGGGYSLLKPPQQISASEVIYAIDGPLFITSCGTNETECELTQRCTIKGPMARVNNSISDLLRSIRISDLTETSGGGPHLAPSQESVATRM